MRLVLDTSVLRGSDLALKRAHGRLLLAASANGEIELVVPQLVIQEAVGILRRELGELEIKMIEARRDYRQLDVTLEATLPDVEATVAAYEQDLCQRLQDAGVRTPAPPEASHLDVASRAIQRQKPFDAHGRAGYRDTLVWMQVLEEAAGDAVVLATANTKDFAGNDKKSLAPELADELVLAGLPRDRVQLATSLTDAVRQHVEPSVEALTRVRVLLDERAFQDAVYEAVNEALLNREVRAPSEDPDFRYLDVSEVEIDSVQDVRDLEVDDAWLDGDVLAFNIGGTLDADVSLYPLKSEIAGADVPDVTVSDWDWNEWVVHASKLVEYGFEGFASYDPAAETIEHVDVWLVY